LTIKDQDLRRELINDLFSMHRELDAQEFEKLSKFSIIKYFDTTEEREFVKYLNGNYLNRKLLWAICYRKNAGINTNILS